MKNNFDPYDNLEARRIAENFIDYAPRTRREVILRLQKSGFDESVIDAVVSELEVVRLIDDADFSQRWVENRSSSKKLGRIRLVNELRRKGVEAEDVENAIQQLSVEEQIETAVSIAEKKVGQENINEPAVRRRLSGFLQRKGYGWDVIEQVLGTLTKNME